MVIPFYLFLWLCLLLPPAANAQLCRVFYGPCHVLSLPKSCSQLRSQLRSADVDGASAQRVRVHYFYFLTEAVNPFCSVVHVLSLISPTREQTAQRRSRRDKNAQKRGWWTFNSFLSLHSVESSERSMLNAQMSNKSIAPIKAAPVWKSGPTAESGSEERSLLSRQKNLFSNAAKNKTKYQYHPVMIVFIQVKGTFLLTWASVFALAASAQLSIN